MVDRNSREFKSRFCVAERKIIDWPGLRCGFWGRVPGTAQVRLRFYVVRSTSSLRTQGPITTDVCYCGRYLTPTLTVRPRRMVPAFAGTTQESSGFQTTVNTTSRSRGLICPSFARNFLALQSEGAGNAGRPMRPIAACAEVVLVSTRVSQVTPETPGIPRAMVLRLIRALPGDRACLPPSPLRSSLPRNLMPASGHQDHTTSPSASVPFVIGASASTASRSTSVAIASAPLTEQDKRGYTLICDFGKSEYFCKGAGHAVLKIAN
jgi:hypothetical protein